MMSRFHSATVNFIPAILLVVALLSFPAISLAQFIPASPPIADPADTRFKGVTEDFTSPALTSSHLHPVLPLVGYVDEQPGYTVELVRVQWRWGDPIDLYIMKPKGVKKPPVVLYLYGYPSSTNVFRNPKFQKFVTKDGFAAVGFMTALTGHRYHDIPMKKWFVSELQRCLSTSSHDVQEVLDYLDKRGDLDMNRVGMFAQLSGASIGILTSAVDPRIRVLDTLDPWGDWPVWMADSQFVPAKERPDYVKPDYLSKVATLDPLDWMPKVKAEKFRLQQRSFETETPVAVKEKLQDAVPPGAIVEWYKTPQLFADAIGGDGSQNLAWIENQLRSLPEKPAENAATAEPPTPYVPNNSGVGP